MLPAAVGMGGDHESVIGRMCTDGRPGLCGRRLVWMPVRMRVRLMRMRMRVRLMRMRMLTDRRRANSTGMIGECSEQPRAAQPRSHQRDADPHHECA